VPGVIRWRHGWMVRVYFGSLPSPGRGAPARLGGPFPRTCTGGYLALKPGRCRYAISATVMCPRSCHAAARQGDTPTSRMATSAKYMLRFIPFFCVSLSNH